MNRIYSATTSMIKYFNGDLKRINHALKVHAYSKLLGNLEEIPLNEQLILEIVAIMHDIGIPQAQTKYNSTAPRYQEKEGPPVALKLLKPSGFTSQELSRITYIIGHHHTPKVVDGNDFQILIEADFIVNAEEEKFKLNTIQKGINTLFKTQTGIRIIKTLYPKLNTFINH